MKSSVKAQLELRQSHATTLVDPGGTVVGASIRSCSDTSTSTVPASTDRCQQSVRAGVMNVEDTHHDDDPGDDDDITLFDLELELSPFAVLLDLDPEESLARYRTRPVSAQSGDAMSNEKTSCKQSSAAASVAASVTAATKPVSRKRGRPPRRSAGAVPAPTLVPQETASTSPARLTEIGFLIATAASPTSSSIASAQTKPPADPVAIVQPTPSSTTAPSALANAAAPVEASVKGKLSPIRAAPIPNRDWGKPYLPNRWSMAQAGTAGEQPAANDQRVTGDGSIRQSRKRKPSRFSTGDFAASANLFQGSDWSDSDARTSDDAARSSRLGRGLRPEQQPGFDPDVLRGTVFARDAALPVKTPGSVGFQCHHCRSTRLDTGLTRQRYSQATSAVAPKNPPPNGCSVKVYDKLLRLCRPCYSYWRNKRLPRPAYLFRTADGGSSEKVPALLAAELRRAGLGMGNAAGVDRDILGTDDLVTAINRAVPHNGLTSDRTVNGAASTTDAAGGASRVPLAPPPPPPPPLLQPPGSSNAPVVHGHGSMSVPSVAAPLKPAVSASKRRRILPLVPDLAGAVIASAVRVASHRAVLHPMFGDPARFAHLLPTQRNSSPSTAHQVPYAAPVVELVRFVVIICTVARPLTCSAACW